MGAAEASLRGKVLTVADRSVKVKKLVGEGAFSYVFVVSDIREGRDIILKHMRVQVGMPCWCVCVCVCLWRVCACAW